MIYQETEHEVTSLGGGHFRYNYYCHYLSMVCVWARDPSPASPAGCLLRNHGRQLSTRSPAAPARLGMISLS